MKFFGLWRGKERNWPEGGCPPVFTNNGLFILEFYSLPDLVSGGFWRNACFWMRFGCQEIFGGWIGHFAVRVEGRVGWGYAFWLAAWEGLAGERS